jgi:Xaa-Pro dipeptidase
MLGLYRKRINQCEERIERSNFSKLLVTSQFNLTYLLNQKIDTGERMVVLLIEPGVIPKLFIHEMFSDRTRDFTNVELFFYSDLQDPIKLLASYIKQHETIGIDQHWPSTFLIDLMKTVEIQVQKSKIIETLRQIKEPEEISTLRQSARIADAVMHQILELQYFPATELELGETIRSFFIDQGVQELSFKPIIGFGKNGANPHHESGQIINSPNEPIVIDMGGVYKNYCSDITRTIVYGKSDKKFYDLYKLVKEVQQEAIEMVAPGITFSEIDTYIRGKLAKWGLDKYFIHRTGHGIGLELHEEPFIHSNNHEFVKEGMVISIEPGVYLPNYYGIRIEDIVAVNNKGCEVLNLFTKEVQNLDLQGVN